MNRPRTTGKHLPPRMLERRKTLKDGKVWIGYYYNGRDDSGARKEFPLGTDLAEAKRKWAELDCKPVPVEAGTMEVVFTKYARDIIPKKAPKTQIVNLAELENLRKVFGRAPIDSIAPKHIAAYRDGRKTKRRLRKDGTVRDPGGKPAPIAANRELALFSDIWNMAREWGYTRQENPCRGVAKNAEQPRDFYADAAVWDAVYAQAVDELKDALDLAYLTAQRPGDVLKMSVHSITADAVLVKQGKTNKFLQIQLDTFDGDRTQLGVVVDRIKAKKVRGFALLTTASGLTLSKHTLRTRFEDARGAAAAHALACGDKHLADRIRKFQFRDVRPKAASEIDDIKHASKLLGHTEEEITKKVYRRVGEKVNPTR